jgi:hypothetical protein
MSQHRLSINGELAIFTAQSFVFLERASSAPKFVEEK